VLLKIGGAIVLVIALLAIAGPLAAPSDPFVQDLHMRLIGQT
jgi:hypothetical protein